jgi:hypothetical protein
MRLPAWNEPVAPTPSVVDPKKLLPLLSREPGSGRPLVDASRRGR